jgi:hypothetical protein
MRLVASFVLAFLTFTTSTAAQTFQLSGHYSALALEYPDQTRSGAGASLVIAPRNWIGADLSASFFAAEDVGGRAWQLLAGPRIGGTWEGLGLFARVRPGFIRFSERFYAPDVICIAIFPPPEACLANATNFSLDLGGTVEVAPTPATVLRFDLGDSLIRYRRPDGASWKHSLQFTAGLGWRF